MTLCKFISEYIQIKFQRELIFYGYLITTKNEIEQEIQKLIDEYREFNSKNNKENE